MRDYGRVRTAFWTDEKMTALSDNGKLLALYLLTGPHSNLIGLYRLPDGYLTADLGWSKEAIRAASDELAEIGFMLREPGSGWIFLRHFLRHNPIENSKVGTKAAGMIEAIPASAIPFFGAFLDEIEPLAERLPKGFVEAQRKRCRARAEAASEATPARPSKPDPDTLSDTVSHTLSDTVSRTSKDTVSDTVSDDAGKGIGYPSRIPLQGYAIQEPNLTYPEPNLTDPSPRARKPSPPAGKPSPAATTIDLDAEARTVVETFHAIVEHHFGNDPPPTLAPKDLSIAKAWLEDGAEYEPIRAHFDDRMGKMAAMKRERPRGLLFFDNSVREDLGVKVRRAG